ncbi:glyoxalase-like domain protein, partial [Zooshikella harenae]
QGTANRRFFFHNAFIELLYLDNPNEINNDITKPTQLSERFISHKSTASPFGICFRPESNTTNKAVPFKSWEYRPTYLPETLKVDVGVAPITEPMWFFLSFSSRPDQQPAAKRQPMEHSVGFKKITSLHIFIPKDTYSEPALYANSTNGIDLVTDEKHIVEIGFDNQICQKSHNFMPTLPLVFKW